MATFGPIASAAPTIWYDPARADAASQAFQRNALLVESGRQDLDDRAAFRKEGPELAAGGEQQDAP